MKRLSIKEQIKLHYMSIKTPKHPIVTGGALQAWSPAGRAAQTEINKLDAARARRERQRSAATVTTIERLRATLREQRNASVCSCFRRANTTGKALHIVHVAGQIGLGGGSINLGHGYYLGNYSSYRVSDVRPCLMLDLDALRPGHLQMIAGVPTLVQSERAWWISGRGRGNAIKVSRGIVINDTHVECATRAEGLRKYAIAQKKQERAELRAAAKRNGALYWVTLNDSLRAGNCGVGTREFIERYGLQGLGAIRSDLLFELQDNTYTRRAYGAATHAVVA